MAVRTSVRMTRLNGKWKNFVEEHVECTSNNCKIWTAVRVAEGVKFDDCGFICGACAYKEILALKENLAETEKKLKKVMDEKVKEMEVCVETEKKILTGVLEIKVKEMESKVEVEKMKWTEVVNRKNSVAAKNAVQSIKENMRREIVSIGEDDKRKKRIVIFGMHEKVGTENRKQVEELLGNLDLDTDVGISEVIRLKKKDDTSLDKPLLIEFESENDKWKVLKKKVILKQKPGYERVFLEMDLSPDVRLERARQYREQKKLREEQQGLNTQENR